MAGRNGRPGAGRSGSQSPGRTTKTVRAPEAATPESLPAQPGIGGPRIHPAEVAANRRRAVALCGYTAIVPSLLVAALCWVAVSAVVAGIGFVVCGLAIMVGVRRLAPAVALHRVGAVPMGDEVDPRLSNITEGLCATFGLSMPALAVLDDDVPNACALGRDARRSVLVVTRGLLEMLDPIELEGVVAHELAHVKRGDNGVSCVGITLATMFGGESMLRRCVGSTREYRADVVGASTVRYPRGLLGALRTMMQAPPPAPGSFFATPSRLGPTRWVWIDPSVGHRGQSPAPGDLDATPVRAAALDEW